MEQTKPPAEAKARTMAEERLVRDPGRGNRSPKLWGSWLLERWGMGRQILDRLNERHRAAERLQQEARGRERGRTPRGTGTMYLGTVRDGSGREARLERSRRKAKAGRRQHVHQSMARRGKR